MLPPEGNEEGNVDGVGARAGHLSLSSPGDRAGDGRAISWEGRQLSAASLQDLRYAPRLGAAGADLEDDGDAVPQDVDCGAAEFCGEPKGLLDGRPTSLELGVESTACRKVEGGVEGASLRGRMS